jgi:glycosyltransferase involved in cell wall biosynthesis
MKAGRPRRYNNQAVSSLAHHVEQRTVLCLIAGPTAIERHGSAMRYLQLGLIDEPIDTVLVLPDYRRALSVAAPAAKRIAHHKAGWPMVHWARRRTVSRATSAIRSFRPGSPVVVHALDIESLPMATQIANAANGRLIVTLSSFDEIQSAEFRQASGRLSFVVSASRVLADRMPVLSIPVEVIHAGVVVRDEPVAFHGSISAASILYVGPLHHAAECDTLLKAVRQVSEQAQTLPVFLVGKGPAELELRALARTLGMADQATFTGRLENWRPAVEAADIFCLPSAAGDVREEPLQALGDGLAVIAARSSIYDCLRHEETALLFPGGDAAALADAIIRLISDPASARNLARQGQTYVREHLSVGRMVADYVRLYRAAAAGPSVPLPAIRMPTAAGKPAPQGSRAD